MHARRRLNRPDYARVRLTAPGDGVIDFVMLVQVMYDDYAGHCIYAISHMVYTADG